MRTVLGILTLVGALIAPPAARAQTVRFKVIVKEIIGKDSISLSRYWEQAIFSGRAVPPPTLSTDLEIMDFVRRNPGAIGYVSANTSLDAALKAIKIVR